VITAALATMNPAPHTCISRRTSVVRHVRDGAEGRAGSDGGAPIGEEEVGRGRGGCIFIRPGAFRIMEHLLATRVSVPVSPGWMHIHSARGISDNGALLSDEG
jgi:hypothetical protein